MTLGPPRPIVALLVVCLGMIAAPLDSSVNIAFPEIATKFGRSVPDIRWVVVAYVLTYASLLLVFGKLGDLVGYRIVFQAGLAIATGGLAACAFAPGFETLLLGRMLQGIGVALVLSCAPALATTLYDERERTRILAIYAGAMALGSVLGPLIGGLLVERLGWSAVFWARIPITVTALAGSWIIPARPGQGSGAGLDPVGSVQLVGALAAFTLGLSVWGDSAGPLVPLVLVATGLVLLALFLHRQTRVPVPIIRPSLFRDPVFSAVNVASAIMNFAVFAVVLIGPFYLLRIARLDTAFAGLVLALGAGGTLAGSAVAARAVSRFGGMATAALGMALTAIGLFSISAWTDDASVVRLALPLLVQGAGIGLFQVAYADRVTATLPLADRGVAGSLTTLTRTLGITVGAVGHAAIHRTVEAAAVADGRTGSAPFMAGFRVVFLIAGTAVLIALVTGLLAAWRQRPATR